MTDSLCPRRARAATAPQGSSRSTCWRQALGTFADGLRPRRTCRGTMSPMRRGVLWAVMAVAGGACAGARQPPTSSAARGLRAPWSGGVVAAAACPPQEPVDRAPCAPVDLRCSYAASPSCGSLWACYAGRWRVLARGRCAATDACPPTAGEPMPAVGAGAPLPSLRCVYPEGVACAYERAARPCSGVPTPPLPGFWRCVRPALTACAFAIQPGEPCAPEGLACGGGCCSQGHRCVGGQWTRFFTPCPP